MYEYCVMPIIKDVTSFPVVTSGIKIKFGDDYWFSALFTNVTGQSKSYIIAADI